MAKNKDKKKGKDKAAKVEAETIESSIPAGGMIIKTVPTVDAISKIQKILDNKVETVQIEMGATGMKIAGSSDASSIQVLVPECKGKGKFSVGIESFRHILTGRSELECTLTDSDLHFKSGKMKGSLKVMPHSPVKVEGDKENTIVIEAGSGLMEHFNKALKNLKISITAAQDTEENFLAVRVQDGQIMCSTYDAVHGGVYQADVDYKGEPMLFNFKTGILRKVIDLGGKQEAAYSLKIGQNIVFVESANIKASITMTQLEAKSFLTYLDIMRATKKAVTSSVELKPNNLEDINTVISTMRGIFEGDKVVELSIKDGKMVWRYATSYGKVEEPLKVKNKGDGSIRLRLLVLEDIMGTLPDTDIFFGLVNIVDKRSSRNQVFIETGGFSYLLQGSQ